MHIRIMQRSERQYRTPVILSFALLKEMGANGLPHQSAIRHHLEFAGCRRHVSVCWYWMRIALMNSSLEYMRQFEHLILRDRKLAHRYSCGASVMRKALCKRIPLAAGLLPR